MRSLPALALALLPLAGCVSTAQLQLDLENTESLLDRAQRLNADKCAGASFAEARAEAAFARLEFGQADVARAAEHVLAARDAAQRAWSETEGCGTQDYDGDGVPDVVDRCIDEPEDIDGDRDDDGCPDLDPYGDLDRDGIRNIDDDCIDEPEDFDGHNDEDGCPETSEDSDGDGIIDAADACPDGAEDIDGFKDMDGCPDIDNDNDSIPDVRDTCPDQEEDFDDWEDDDGCPDVDNDGDGIMDLSDACPWEAGSAEAKGCPTADADGDGVSDSRDQCPTEPETRNGYLDGDGCPDDADQLARLDPSGITLQERVAFVGETADFEARAYDILGAVADLLQSQSSLRIRIEGHTDARGDEAARLALSRKRAEAVRDWLIGQGVGASRLTVEGYGGTRPIDTNRTASGRAANNRIVFTRLD